MIKTEEKAKVVAAAWETELIQFFATLDSLHQDDLKKRMNRITATWRNGCFEKMDNHEVHIPYVPLYSFLYSDVCSFHNQTSFTNNSCIPSHRKFFHEKPSERYQQASVYVKRDGD